MNLSIITEQQVAGRKYWLDHIGRISANFGIDANRIEQEISNEIEQYSYASLLGHLRLCGAIPEAFSHDSTQEKLYSKYTDVVIHQAFTTMGFTSLVLKERADVADVECAGPTYSFVADAKAFRLSRTAQNQKDFKVQSMDTWKRSKPYAMIVCPVYQLPSRTSQIYQQAIVRSVCVCTYTHLAVLVRYANEISQTDAQSVLKQVFESINTMNPSKNAGVYWQTLNQALLNADDSIASFWQEEKVASVEAIHVAREEALHFLALERERIMRLSRQEAIQEVLKWRKIETKIQTINAVANNGLLEL